MTVEELVDGNKNKELICTFLNLVDNNCIRVILRTYILIELNFNKFFLSYSFAEKYKIFNILAEANNYLHQLENTLPS